MVWSPSGRHTPLAADVSRRHHRPVGPLVMLALALVLSACGSADDDSDTGTTPGPTVADVGLDGRYVVSRLEAGGSPIELVLDPVIDIDARFGDLTVRPGCNTFLGSFTLAADGAASFTVTGGGENDCAELDQPIDNQGRGQEQVVLETLAAVDRWSLDGSALTLSGPDVRLELARSES